MLIFYSGSYLGQRGDYNVTNPHVGSAGMLLAHVAREHNLLHDPSA